MSYELSFTGFFQFNAVTEMSVRSHQEVHSGVDFWVFREVETIFPVGSSAEIQSI